MVTFLFYFSIVTCHSWNKNTVYNVCTSTVHLVSVIIIAIPDYCMNSTAPSLSNAALTSTLLTTIYSVSPFICSLAYVSSGAPTPPTLQCQPYNFLHGQWNLTYSCLRVHCHWAVSELQIFICRSWTFQNDSISAANANYCSSAPPTLSNANYPPPAGRYLYNSTYYTCNDAYESSTNSTSPLYQCSPYLQEFGVWKQSFSCQRMPSTNQLKLYNVQVRLRSYIPRSRKHERTHKSTNREQAEIRLIHTSTRTWQACPIQFYSSTQSKSSLFFHFSMISCFSAVQASVLPVPTPFGGFLSKCKYCWNHKLLLPSEHRVFRIRRVIIEQRRAAHWFLP